MTEMDHVRTFSSALWLHVFLKKNLAQVCGLQNIVLKS